MEKGFNNFNYGLSFACLGHHLDLVNLMLSLGAKNYDNVLITASKMGCIYIVKRLIEVGARSFDKYIHRIRC